MFWSEHIDRMTHCIKDGRSTQTELQAPGSIQVTAMYSCFVRQAQYESLSQSVTLQHVHYN